MQTFKRSALLALAAVAMMAGCKGDDGKDGAPGAACTLTNNVDGSATITCPSGTFTVNDGIPGADGTSCTMVDNLDGTAQITCGTAPAVTVGTQKSTVESCAGCHNAGLPGKHTRTNQVTVANAVTASANSLDAVPVVNGDLLVTFNIKVDGLNRNDFTHLASVAQWTFNAAADAGTRTRYSTDPLQNPTIFATFTVTPNFNGNYTVRMPGFGSAGATPMPNDTILLVAMNTGNSQPAASVIAKTTFVAPPPVVSNQACMNCHGNNVFSALDALGVPSGHHGANPIGVDACVVCHDRDDTKEDRLATPTVPFGTRLRGYVHGIHNSHNMPGAVDTSGVPVPGGKYYRNGSATSTFSIGFPGFQNNCSNCHDTPAALAVVAASPVRWDICMACHIGPPTLAGTQVVAAGWAWAGYGVANTGTATAPIFSFNGTNHAGFTAATNCAGCHDGSIAPASLGSFHNGLRTERAGVIWDGVDQSVIEGAKFDLAVTGVTRAGTNYEVTWTASYNGAPVNPCNTDFAVGPVFMGVAADAATGKSASNMQFVKAYGQGDDWVNADRTGTVAPGQPATSATLAAANTTCSANVATTTTPVDTFVTAGTKGTMALQGKPQLRFVLGAGTASEFIQARAESPTYNFVVPAADGAATAGAARRTIVDTAKCLACHKGSLYQHGGNRVDSVPLCVTCHNPAANEMNNRVLFQVDATEAYDGKPGEAYDLRNMVHSIHSAGETGRAYVVYRTRGIYFFGNQASLDNAIANKNWPTTGGVTCIGGEGASVTYYPVYGSVGNGTTDLVPTVNGDGTCNTTTGPVSTVGVWQIHNVVLVEYPRPLSDCGACHAAGWVPAAVDATKGVAVTVDTGAAPYGNQLNDVLMGPTAASCMSCHQSGDAGIQAGLREHAFDNGFVPSVFVNGRQTLLDAILAMP